MNEIPLYIRIRVATMFAKGITYYTREAGERPTTMELSPEKWPLFARVFRLQPYGPYTDACGIQIVVKK